MKVNNMTLPVVPTQIIENFLSDEDIDIINSEINDNPQACNPIIINGKTERIMESIFADTTDFYLPKSTELMKKRMADKFGDDLYIGVCNVLRAFDPYQTHTDGIYGNFGIDDNHFGAYTCVLPLADYNSNTIIFDQMYEKTKIPDDWIRDTNAQPIDAIDDETYEKYFSHEKRDLMRYFSIETIFPWKKGNMLVASRYKFHTSDNFLANGLTEKRAIIMWTALPLNS